MKRICFNILPGLALAVLIISCTSKGLNKSLIITGQQEHNWKVSSYVLKQILDNTGLFSTEILITPEKGGDMTRFDPDFSKYKLVLIDYYGDSWSEKTRTAFVDYVRNGGGVVIYHGSSGSFPDWQEYNEITGIGGGSSRNELNGPYVYYRNNELVTDTASGTAGSHGERHEFEIRIRNSEHPVTKGLPVRWMHGSDDLYQKMRGPARNMQVLATAYADTTFGGTGRDEPMLMAIEYGKGRIFHTAMGHADEDGGPAIKCAGFIITLQRGAEWAATGTVTQEVPSDFPTAAGVILRPDYSAITMEKALEYISDFSITKSTRYFTYLQQEIRKSAGNEEMILDIEKKMVSILNDAKATYEAKKMLLRELSWMGSDYCLETIRKLTEDPELKDDADYALARLQN